MDGKIKGDQRLAWYDYNRQDTRSPGNKNIKGPFFLGWLAQLYRQETYTRETHQSDVTQHDPRAHPSSCQNQIHISFSFKSNGTYYSIASSTCSKGVCAHCKGALSTHFSRPVVRDAILTRAPLSVHTHARPPSHIQGPGVQDQAAAVHILRSPDFFRRINKKTAKVRPSISLCFYCRLKNILGYDWKLSTTIWRRFAQGQMVVERGGTLHLEANSAAGCRCTY